MKGDARKTKEEEVEEECIGVLARGNKEPNESVWMRCALRKIVHTRERDGQAK